VIASILPLLLLAMTSVSPPAAQALNQQQGATLYAVSYIEVAPSAAAAAARLLRQLAEAAGKDEGNQRFEILKRIAPENQFVIVAIWKDVKAYEDHLADTHAKDFRAQINPHLISAIDERLHSGMAIASVAITIAPQAIYVITHVDVPPPKKDDCISALNALVTESRKEAGALRFEVFQQISRPNHFSVVEVWGDPNAYERHITAGHTKGFRDELTPMSGALYDERLYRALQVFIE
jgi:quinol monooxygenase YgiN